MEAQKVILTKQDSIAYITLNDPENRNALSAATADTLTGLLDECDRDPEVRVVVLRGEGPAFSAGGNVKSMLERLDAGTADYRPGTKKLGTAFIKLRTIRKPVIAAIHGAAAGGGLSLALGCDFRIAAEDTKFVFAFVHIGLIPDVGGPLSLVRILGAAKATELLMTGKLFTAQEAHEWGLVNDVVAAGELAAATLKLATKLASGPTQAYGCIKAMINHVAFNDLDQEIEREAEYQVLCSKTHDHREGVSAFVKKRKPQFTGL
ncbi:MAG: enoyl-CoA hydratase-related protein [Sporomusaceae bacterium]|nr:enoyl-CoA hydratase-related protein [Sporomusaceae bacterium]